MNSKEQNRTEQNRTEHIPIDLSINQPRVIQIANCIMARENRGICNFQGVGNGVVTVTIKE